MNWKDRVKEFRRVRSSELRANPKNWREHPPEQRNALTGILDEIGIAGAVLARETPEGLELIDGHLRTEMDDSTEWPVLVLDVTEEEANTLLLAVDPIGAMATRSEQHLELLLDEVRVASKELDEFLNTLRAKEPTIPVDEPEFDPSEIEPTHRCPQCGFEWKQ